MNNIKITPAGIGELGTLMQWRMTVLHDVFADYKSVEWETLRQANLDYYSRAIPSGHHLAVLARFNEEIVGCGGVCFYPEMPSPDNYSGKCAYLMNIYVDPAHRHEGIGHQIVQYLINASKSRGAEKIYLETSDHAASMYSSLGFMPMPAMMKYEG